MNTKDILIELEIIKQDLKDALKDALNGYETDFSWMQPRKLLSKERIKKLDEVFLRLDKIINSDKE